MGEGVEVTQRSPDYLKWKPKDLCTSRLGAARLGVATALLSVSFHWLNSELRSDSDGADYGFADNLSDKLSMPTNASSFRLHL